MGLKKWDPFPVGGGTFVFKKKKKTFQTTKKYRKTSVQLLKSGSAWEKPFQEKEKKEGIRGPKKKTSNRPQGGKPRKKKEEGEKEKPKG